MNDLIGKVYKLEDSDSWWIFEVKAPHGNSSLLVRHIAGDNRGETLVGKDLLSGKYANDGLIVKELTHYTTKLGKVLYK